jgi:hypothetical protein
MPRKDKRTRKNKKTSRRTRSRRCGGGARPHFFLKTGGMTRGKRFEEGAVAIAVGGRRRGGGKRVHFQKGGAWYDPILGSNYSINPISSFFSTGGINGMSGTLYGTAHVNPNPTSQNVAYYNSHNPRIA